ncbi:MAG: hypothetical protein KDA41_17745, partial [Planctomycetales bacterium]|nr:hypothetical protein [Planctomycetales bacterium]
MIRWSIRTKLLVCVALLMAAVSTLTYGAISGVYAYRGMTRGISRRAAELPLASEMAQHVSDLRVTLSKTRRVREIRALTGETPIDSQSLREQFRIDTELLRDSLRRYGDQLAGGEDTDPEIGDFTREQETVAKIEQSLARIDELNNSEDWVLDQINVDLLHDELGQLHALTTELPTHLQGRMESLAHEVKGKYRAWIVLTWGTSLFSVAMLVTMFILMYRWVFSPMRKLLHGSRIVAAGAFSHRIHVD